MSSGRMHAETFAILRHLEVHGPRSKKEVAKGVGEAEAEVARRLSNLSMLGYLAEDSTTKPVSWHLTGKARQKLAAPDAVYPRRPKQIPKKPLEAESPGLSAAKAARLEQRAAPSPSPVTRRMRAVNGGEMSAPYRSTEYSPSVRPGANDAFALPSRMGDSLRYRDGRITDMDGTPLP